MRPHLLLFILLSLVPTSVFAGFKGSISFTTEERLEHLRGQDRILSEAASCIEADIVQHQKFFRKHGFSRFYGDRSAFGKLSVEEKRSFLARSGFHPDLVRRMESTSCVGLLLKCLGKGFAVAGQNHLWQRIRKYTVLNGVGGTAMQAGLRELGWVVLYWNADTRMNGDWDRAEVESDPANKDRFWGYHHYNWLNASKKSKYLYNVVDDSRLLVNFGSQTPSMLKKIPFFVGTAHGGYHVFPGTFGRVIESHSTRDITDPKTLESDAFNPLAGQAPTGGKYKSGLIAVPAKYVR